MNKYIGVSVLIIILIFLGMWYFQSTPKTQVIEPKAKVLACETSDAIDGFDYLSQPVDKSIFEIRTSDWKQFSSSDGLLTLKYPKHRTVYTHYEGSNTYDVVDTEALGYKDFYSLVKIEVADVLPEDEGWSSEEVFNNQNDIDKQLKRLEENNAVFDYEPCIENLGGDTLRVLVRTSEGLHLFLKDSGRYVHASLTTTLPGESVRYDEFDAERDEEEEVLIMNSIRFKSR